MSASEGITLLTGKYTIEMSRPTHGALDMKRWGRLQEALAHHWGRMKSIEDDWPETGGVEAFDQALRASTDTVNEIGATLKKCVRSCLISCKDDKGEDVPIDVVLQEKDESDSDAAKTWLALAPQLTEAMVERACLGKS